MNIDPTIGNPMTSGSLVPQRIGWVSGGGGIDFPAYAGGCHDQDHDDRQ